MYIELKLVETPTENWVSVIHIICILTILMLENQMAYNACVVKFVLGTDGLGGR